MEMIFKGNSQKLKKLRKELKTRLRNDGIVTKDVIPQVIEKPIEQKKAIIKLVSEPEVLITAKKSTRKKRDKK